jgi:beta-1,4-mannosyltransferase
MFVTGKGPLRELYMRKARSLQDGEGDPWQWVHITSTWLEPREYPLLLGKVFSHPGTHMLNSPLVQGQQTWASRCIRALRH